MDGGPWWAAVHGVARSRTRLSDFTFIFHFHALEKEMATHSSVLAWRIPGMGEPGGLPFMRSQRVGHDWSDLAAAAAYSFSRGTSWPRNRTRCIAGGFFTNWTIRAYNRGSVNISGMNGWQIWLLFGSSIRIQRTSMWVGRAGVDFIDET